MSFKELKIGKVTSWPQLVSVFGRTCLLATLLLIGLALFYTPFSIKVTKAGFNTTSRHLLLYKSAGSTCQITVFNTFFDKVIVLNGLIFDAAK